VTQPENTCRRAHEALADLWRLGGGLAETLDNVDFTRNQPVAPSTFCVGTSAQVSIAAAGLAATELHALRGGERQRVHVDRLHAATEFQSERYLRLDDKRLELWDELSGTYHCGDGRWLRIHTMFAHHCERIVDILGCASERDALVRAFEGWSAAEFEERAVEAGAIAAMMRSQAQWHEHPQHEALDSLPVVTIDRIGGAPPESMPIDDRPLGGVRVLDLTRIIAGPVAGRALAAHGADVLRYCRTLA
jgi:hypothetical protein